VADQGMGIFQALNLWRVPYFSVPNLKRNKYMSYYIKPQHIMNDISTFREKMGLKSSNPDELQEMFNNLTAAWLMAASTRKHPDATDDEIETMDSCMDSLIVEWPMRYSMMVTQPMSDAVRNLNILFNQLLTQV